MKKYTELDEVFRWIDSLTLQRGSKQSLSEPAKLRLLLALIANDPELMERLNKRNPALAKQVREAARTLGFLKKEGDA
jgi:hypothetical protein